MSFRDSHCPLLGCGPRALPSKAGRWLYPLLREVPRSTVEATLTWPRCQAPPGATGLAYAESPLRARAPPAALSHHSRRGGLPDAPGTSPGFC